MVYFYGHKHRIAYAHDVRKLNVIEFRKRRKYLWRGGEHEVCNDFDEGIQYMFDIYEGSFEQIVYQNTSTDKHYEGDYVTTMAEPIFVLKTTADKYYKLRYTVWKSNRPDFEKQGVYSIYFFECEADSMGAGGGPYIAGIDHPKRYGADDAIGNILYSLTRADSELLKESIDEEVLTQDNNSERLDEYITSKGMLSYSGIGPAWIRISEDKTECYQMLYTKPQYCIYFRVDGDKIVALKYTEIEKGKTIDDYDLTLSEPGIVLP